MAQTPPAGRGLNKGAVEVSGERVQTAVEGGHADPARAQTLDLAAVRRFQREFVAAREWEQFHTPKNLAMSLAGEAGELLEIFQWLTPEQSARIADTPKGKEAVEHELADVLAGIIRLADVLGIDLPRALWAKLRLNEQKYPAALAKGHARKHTELSGG